MNLSLYFFGGYDTGVDTASYYDFVTEAAQIADEGGLTAIWTPERHFHPFGGYFPNPSVLNASLARATKAIQLRAGSVALPLHDPIRVVEEWALVDQLSRGRVGLSFASGWHDRDFILSPHHFDNRRAIMEEQINVVKKLWSGEAIERQDGRGKTQSVSVFPHPFQKELPLWITAAGTLNTFVKAGEWQANILTHLLGQSIEELKPKVDAYRTACKMNTGQVTLMLHTYIGTAEESVKPLVEEPMKRYLATSLDLLGKADSPWSSGAFRAHYGSEASAPKTDMSAVSEKDESRDAILNFAFERYYAKSGLFGDREHCLQRLAELQAMGVDEVACLVDFGLPFEKVIEGVKRVVELNQYLKKGIQLSAPSIVEPSTSKPIDKDAIESLSGEALRVYQIFASVLKQTELSLTDDFFDLGGNSVLATELMAELYADSDEIPEVALIFTNPILGDFIEAWVEKSQAT